jgi:RimJ/RimL family protein N-acetyltransferase
MLTDAADITFDHPTPDQFELIYQWFTKPHVAQYFDDPETGRSIPDLKNYLAGNDYFFTPWLAYYKDTPFAYLMTAEVKKHETGLWSKWREKKGKTYSMDILIGEDEFLGKGMSPILIQKFIQDNFQHAAAMLIDPELRNIHAIHVYEKAGFIIVDQFKGEHGRFAGIPHLMMKLKLSSEQK